MKTQELMSKNVVTIDYKDSALEAVKLMLKNKIRHIPVMRKDKIMGMLSVEQLQSLRGPLDYISVGKICDKFVVYAEPNSEVEEISHAFQSVKVQAVPVLDDSGHVVGIVTPMDFVKFLPDVVSYIRAKDVSPQYA
jgi:CBS domain-containing protein